MTAILQTLGSTPPWILLSLVFVLPGLEASTFLGLLVPGETMVVLGGVAAHAGRVQLLAVILLAILGAVLGDQVGFLLGSRYGPRLVARLPAGSRRQQHAERALALVRRRGSVAVFLGRWIATVRSVVPGVAGMSGMRWRSFTGANVVGGVLWASAVAVAGYLAGASLRLLEGALGTTGEVGLGILLASALVWWIWTRRHTAAAPQE